MQSALRAINIIVSPALTIFFASRLEGYALAGQNSAEIVGGAAAGLIVLAIEVLITQGPKYSLRLRRWLDPRAAFEGIWLQDVFDGQSGNDAGLFSIRYQREEDSFVVHGVAYSADVERYATWDSTHMFIDKGRLTATYLWKGELLKTTTPASDKTGVTELELTPPPAFALPMNGEGRVPHVGESVRVKFLMYRVTNRRLQQLGVRFTVRELQIDADGEARTLVETFVRRGKKFGTEEAQPRGALGSLND